jgi:hypothetical protein
MKQSKPRCLMKGEQIILFDLFVASSNTRKKGRRGAG